MYGFLATVLGIAAFSALVIGLVCAALLHRMLDPIGRAPAFHGAVWILVVSFAGGVSAFLAISGALSRRPPGLDLAALIEICAALVLAVLVAYAGALVLLALHRWRPPRPHMSDSQSDPAAARELRHTSGNLVSPPSPQRAHAKSTQLPVRSRSGAVAGGP